MKRAFFLVFLFLTVLLNAQNSQKQEFDDFLKQTQEEFDSFEKQTNYEFAETLKNQWEEFQVFKGEEMPSKPKPKVMPVAPTDTNLVSFVIQGTPAPEENSILGSASRIVLGKWLKWKSKKLSEDDLLRARKTLGKHVNESALIPQPLKKMMTFYNTPVNIDVPAAYSEYKMTDNKEVDVANFWTFLTASGFEYVAQQIAEFAEDKGLENWGLFRFIEVVSENVYPTGKENEKEVFTVFLANQLGLDVRIGRANDTLICLIAIAQQVYEWMSIKIEGTKYYFRYKDKELKYLYTYKMPFNETVTQVDLLKSMPFNLSPPAKIQTRVLKSKVLDCDINIALDTNLCKFQADFPRVRCDIPAITDLGNTLAESLYETFQPMIKDLNQYDAVNLLMKFMHNDFDYATDTEQFGYEKPFFCEENFLYPFNDCEDRSILFACLVRGLLEMDVILLDYPDHITTAIAFDEEINGAYVLIDDKKFFICDPTYINSLPGMSQPRYLNEGCLVLRI